MAAAASNRKCSAYWTTPRPSVPFVPSRNGSGLWTLKPGKREVWSYLTYAMNTGKTNRVKIFVLETTMENKRRFVGPTFHTPQEAKKFLSESELAWPGDEKELDLESIREEGLIKVWSRVWSMDVEECVKKSAESVERFVETFNTVGKTLHVQIPKVFADQLLLQLHSEHGANNNWKYSGMGGFFFPERPSWFKRAESDEDKEEEEVNEEALVTVNGAVVQEIPVHRRVYSFSTILVDNVDRKRVKCAFVRSRDRGDIYFVAVTVDFEYDELETLKKYFQDEDKPYPDFDFDAKWMLEDLTKTVQWTSGRGIAF